ncbi:Uncharacterised protein [Mycobacteroides abscessus subsp. abscessus]|nr:Uncharacterised protein [Mycobacteroides abscessus subsp. abscessus]
MFQISETHYAATWLLAENAPVCPPPAELLERIERMKKEDELYVGTEETYTFREELKAAL